VGDPLWFFTHLGGFDHTACDVVLRSRHIDVPGISLSKGPGDYSIYGQSAICVAVLAGLGYVVVREIRKDIGDPAMQPHSFARRAGIAVVALAYLFFVGTAVWAQASGIAAYVTTCRALGVR
jgi:hypothetical protein